MLFVESKQHYVYVPRTLIGGSGEKSISELIPIVGQIQFLILVELQSLFSCWLSELVFVPRGCPHFSLATVGQVPPAA